MTAQATPSITELDTFMSSIVNYIRNTSIDPEYCFEKDFKLEFKHRFVYPNQYPGYSQKILDLKAKNHSTEEILGFQLLPYKFCTNDMCLPMLNKGFMTELWKYQIQNRLLSHLQPQGISLYKSVDVLLKVMIQSNRRYAKIAVYKLMPGRTKVQFCCVEDLSREYENFKLDSEYDSGMLELLDETPVKYMSLRDQLMCSQIMVHELHEHKVDGRTMFFNEDAPRQITPVTVLTFTSLRPKFSLHTLGYNRILPATPAFVIEVKEGNVMMANGQMQTKRKRKLRPADLTNAEAKKSAKHENPVVYTTSISQAFIPFPCNELPNNLVQPQVVQPKPMYSMQASNSVHFPSTPSPPSRNLFNPVPTSHTSPTAYFNTTLTSTPTICSNDMIAIAALSAGVTPENVHKNNNPDNNSNRNKSQNNNNNSSSNNISNNNSDNKNSPIDNNDICNNTKNNNNNTNNSNSNSINHTYDSCPKLPTKTTSQELNSSFLDCPWMDQLLSELQCLSDTTTLTSSSSVNQSIETSVSPKNPEPQFPTLNLPSSHTSSQDTSERVTSLLDLLNKDINTATTPKQQPPDPVTHCELHCYETISTTTASPVPHLTGCITPTNTAFASPSQNPISSISNMITHHSTGIQSNSSPSSHSVYHNPPKPPKLSKSIKKESKVLKTKKKCPNSVKKAVTPAKLNTPSTSHVVFADSSLISLSVQIRRRRKSSLIPSPKLSVSVVHPVVKNIPSVRLLNHLQSSLVEVQRRSLRLKKLNLNQGQARRQKQVKGKNSEKLDSKNTQASNSRTIKKNLFTGEFLFDISAELAVKATKAVTVSSIENQSFQDKETSTLQLDGKDSEPLKESNNSVTPMGQKNTPKHYSPHMLASHASNNTSHSNTANNLAVCSPASAISSVESFIKRRKMFHGRPLMVKHGEPLDIALTQDTSISDPRKKLPTVTTILPLVKWSHEEGNKELTRNHTNESEKPELESSSIRNPSVTSKENQNKYLLNSNDISSPYMDGCSQFRVNLLLLRHTEKPDDPLLLENLREINIPVDPEDRIPFGSSPRDFFPSSSSESESNKSLPPSKHKNKEFLPR